MIRSMYRRALEILFHERTVMAAIAVNALLLMVSGFHEQDSLAADLRRFDYLFVVYFSFEVTRNVVRQGPRTFFGSGMNPFDFVVVLASLPILLEHWLPVAGTEFVLVARSIRLLRLVRSFRLVPNFEPLWAGVKRALRASLGVFAALLVFIVIVGMFAHALFGEAVPDYFGNPAISMYSVFQLITLEGWNDIADAVAAHSGPGMAVAARVFFALTVVIGGILGLSLANAIFVDEMVIDNQSGMEAKIERLREELERALAHQTSSLQNIEEKLGGLALLVDNTKNEIEERR
jgi:voltage-gated sodium channel